MLKDASERSLKAFGPSARPTVTDAIGRQMVFFRDSVGRMLRGVVAGGRETRFGYDASGNLTSLTPPERPAYTFAYSPSGRMISATPPDVGDPRRGTVLRRNLDHQLTTILRPEGDSVMFAYDS